MRHTVPKPVMELLQAGNDNIVVQNLALLHRVLPLSLGTIQ